MTSKIEERISNINHTHPLLINNLLDGIWLIDTETLRFTYISPSIEKISGYSREDLKIKPLEEILTRHSFQIITKTLKKALKSSNQPERNWKNELEMYHKNKTKIWIEVHAKLIREEDTHPRLFGVIRDITRKKKYEQEREILVTKLKHNLEEQEKLLRENKILKGLLPICSNCKMIRDENNHWHNLEEYISSRTDADFTHTTCPDCMDVLYGNDIWYQKKMKEKNHKDD